MLALQAALRRRVRGLVMGGGGLGVTCDALAVCAPVCGRRCVAGQPLRVYQPLWPLWRDAVSDGRSPKSCRYCWLK